MPSSRVAASPTTTTTVADPGADAVGPVRSSSARSKVLRRVALQHMLLSYLFGAVIGATVINVVAGLFRG